MRRARIHVRPNVSKLANVSRNRKSEIDLTAETAKPTVAKETNETHVKIEPLNNLDKVGDKSTTRLYDAQQEDKLQTVFLENVESLEVIIPENPIKVEAVLHGNLIHIEEVTPENAVDNKVKIPECPIESATGNDRSSQYTLDVVIKLDDFHERPLSPALTVLEVETRCETNPLEAKSLSLEDYLRDTASEPDPVTRIDGEVINDSISLHRDSYAETVDAPNLQNIMHDDDSPIEPLSPTKSAKNRSPVKAKKEVFPRRRYLKGKEPLDKEKMTMSDLIYWNPTDNPMKYPPKSNHPQANFVPQRRVFDSDSESNAAETHEQEHLPVPKLIIGPNGEVTIDEESLYIKQSLPEISAVVYEAAPTTYSSFREKRVALKWSKRDTILFYRALSSIGTDFTIMASLLKKWKRYDLKQKYKHELKRNADFVQNIVRKADCLNMKLLEKILTEELLDDEFEKEVMENQKKSRKRGAPKKKAVPNSKNQEPSVQCGENFESVDDSTGIENACNQGINGSCAPVKKKRGRKPKAQKEAESQLGTTTENTAAIASQPIKKKRGRKPKIQKDTNVNLESDGCNMPEPLPVQQRSELPAETSRSIVEESEGRQQDERQLTTMLLDNSNEDKLVLQESNEPVKKRPGRKQKPKSDKEVHGVEESTTEPTKKKRGRKQKPKSDKDVNEGCAAQHVKKKRGRKPKVLEEEIVTDMESSDDNMSDNSISYPKRQRRLSAISTTINYNEESDEDISVENIDDMMELCEVEVQLPAEGNTDESNVIDLNKKHRGRKPKPKLDGQHNGLEKNPATQPLKNKRGRKPKIPRETAVEILASNTLPATSQSGEDMQTLPSGINYHENILLEYVELQKPDSSVGRSGDVENTNILVSLESRPIKQENRGFGALHHGDGIEERFISKTLPVVADSSQENEIALSLDGNTENGVLVSETGEVIPYQVIASAHIAEAASKGSADVVNHNVLIPADPNSSDELLLPLITESDDSECRLSHPEVKLEKKENISEKLLHSPTHTIKRTNQICVNNTSNTPIKFTNENNRESAKLSTNTITQHLLIMEKARTKRSHRNLNDLPEKSAESDEGVDLSVAEIGSYVTIETERQCKRKRKDDKIVNADSGKRTPKYSDFTIEESDCLSVDNLENKLESLPDYDSNLILSSVQTAECQPERDGEKNRNISDKTRSPVSQHAPSIQTPKCLPGFYSSNPHQITPEVKTSMCLASKVPTAAENRQGDNLRKETKNASTVCSNSEKLSASLVLHAPQPNENVNVNNEIILLDFHRTTQSVEISPKHCRKSPEQNRPTTYGIKTNQWNKTQTLESLGGLDVNGKRNMACFEGKLVTQTLGCDTNGAHKLSISKESSAILRTPEKNSMNNNNNNTNFGETNYESDIASSIQVTEHAPENGRNDLHSTHNTIISDSIRIPTASISENHVERKRLSSTSPKSFFSNQHKFSPLNFRTSINQPFVPPITPLINGDKSVPSSPLLLLNSSSQKGVVHIFALNSPSRNQNMFPPDSVSEESENIKLEGSNPPCGLINGVIGSFNMRKTMVDVHNN